MKSIVHTVETIDLKKLRYFLVTAEMLNFTVASRRLNIPKSALSKAIRRLEEEFSAPLFIRSSRSVRLTEAGRVLQKRATTLLQEAALVINDVRTLQHSVAGELSIAAPPILGRFLSHALLPAFSHQWPDISVSLKLSYQYENLFAEGLDMAFRMGKNRDEALIEKPLGWSNRVVVASPDYAMQFDNMDTPEQLTHCRAVQFFMPEQSAWALKNGEALHSVTPKTVMQCEDFIAVLNAVKAGMGVAQLPWLLVRDDVRNKALTVLLPEWQSPAIPISLVYRQGFDKPEKVAQFIHAIEANQSLFELRYGLT